jgi:hypothetical protein
VKILPFKMVKLYMPEVRVNHNLPQFIESKWTSILTAIDKPGLSSGYAAALKPLVDKPSVKATSQSLPNLIAFHFWKELTLEGSYNFLKDSIELPGTSLTGVLCWSPTAGLGGRGRELKKADISTCQILRASYLSFLNFHTVKNYLCHCPFYASLSDPDSGS